jgi:putative FmdB family regulatory protein
MPIYEYHCQRCGIIEITQKITDKALSRCPKCKGKIKKLISHTSFHLKGTGWYATDYARKDNKDGEAKEKKAPAAESKSEAKPAAEKSSTEKKTSKPAASGSSAD